MVGMMAAVRNRRGVVSAVAPFGGEAEARLHLVTVEYTDPDGPPEDVLVWERERAPACWSRRRCPTSSASRPCYRRSWTAWRGPRVGRP